VDAHSKRGTFKVWHWVRELSYKADTVGSAIGAGLLFDSGRPLYLGGPVSLLLAYILMSSVLYAVLVFLSFEVINF
jgi:hypothetical protein